MNKLIKWLFGNVTVKDVEINEWRFLYAYRKVLKAHGLQGFYYETYKCYLVGQDGVAPKGVDCLIIPYSQRPVLGIEDIQCDKETYLKYGGR